MDKLRNRQRIFCGGYILSGKPCLVVLCVVLALVMAQACSNGPTETAADAAVGGSTDDDNNTKDSTENGDDDKSGDGDGITDNTDSNSHKVNGEPDDESNYLFSPDEIRTYEIKLSEKNLAFLDRDPAAEQYVEGELVFEGQTISPVGIRYKGSAGAFSICTGGGFGGIGNAAKTCPKMSMKVKINWQDPDALFYGVRKLQFHAMNSDDSLMREQLGYRTFRAMGIAAPRTAYVRLLINGELEGLFLLVEQVDGRFTRSRFQEGGKGNLYKEVWPVHLNANPYRRALRTNEDEDPSFARPRALASELRNAEPDARKAVVDRWMDLDYILRYVAADRVILHDDGPFHWYCGIPVAQGSNPGNCGNHNYYWYEAQNMDRFWIIAWDLDLAFGGNESTFLEDTWNNRQPDCNMPFWGLFGQRPPACDPLIYTWGGLTEPYRKAIDELLAGPFSVQTVNSHLDKWDAHIEDAVAEASKLPGHLSVNGWKAALDDFKGAIKSQRDGLANE